MALHKENYGLIYNDDGSLCVALRKDDVPFEGVTSFAVEEGTTNLVPNPGFENGTINGWGYMAGGSAPDYNYAVTTEDSWEGNYCVKLWTSSNATKDSSIATVLIPVDTTKTYACSVCVKGDVQELTVQCFDSNNVFLVFSLPIRN